MNIEPLVTGVYIVCSILFILSLGGLSSPETSKRGNWYGVTSMFFAIISTCIYQSLDYYFWCIPAVFLGGFIGSVMALRVQMTNIPQLVAALHSFVGLSATLVAISEFLIHNSPNILSTIETILGVFIGAVTFAGSIVAYGKFSEFLKSEPLILFGPVRHVLNVLMLLGCVTLSYFFAYASGLEQRAYFLVGLGSLASLLGAHIVLAIGTSDMPVVVSILNSYSGWATSANGFLLQNWLLIITGALVGSSGAILSYIMCKAMNRSYISFVVGGFGGSPQQDDSHLYGRQPETIDTINTVKMLKSSKSVIIVPGHGMADSGCHYLLSELTRILVELGRKIKFCVHPVAGRLPGLMNILLAEADIDYKIVKSMDEINEKFREADLVLVIGANDTVNPDAIDNENCSIAGMPVCKVWEAKNVIVFKKNPLDQGYSKVENPLFTKKNTKMYYGDALDSLTSILRLVKINLSEFSHLETCQNNENDTSIDEDILNLEGKMSIGVPKEIVHLEKRVAVTPNMVKKFRKLGFSLKIEKGAGLNANFSDEEYLEAGCKIVSQEEVWKNEIILKVAVVQPSEVHLIKGVKLVVSIVNPSQNSDFLTVISEKHNKLVYLAMDCTPRMTRAQKMDTLSSMGNLQGYRAVIEAFQVFQKCPTQMVTAAGKVPSAQVLVIGAGVAGLAAIGFCKNLGCVVKATDTRISAKAEAEAMGATFLEVKVQDEGPTDGGYAIPNSEEYLAAQHQIIKANAQKSDIIITTALIHGRKPDVVIDADIVYSMKPGSVIVDLAAEMGGNCELTVKDKIVVSHNQVNIVGFTDLISRVAPQASELYANNLWNLLSHIGGASHYYIDEHDEIIGAMIVVKNGKANWYKNKVQPPPSQLFTTGKIVACLAIPEVKKSESCWKKIDFLVVSFTLLAIFTLISYFTHFEDGEIPFIRLVAIFVLAIFIGFMVIWNVTPVLHTPLMSVTNAISGIIIIGAMMLLTPIDFVFYDIGPILVLASVMFASINIFGGFIVTYRMLKLFKTKN